MFSQVARDKIYHQFYLARRQLVAKRGHAVAALGYLFLDLGFGFEFQLAFAKAGHDLAVIERFTVTLGTVADGTVLAEKRCLVGFTVGYHISRWFGTKTRCESESGEDNYYGGLGVKHVYPAK